MPLLCFPNTGRCLCSPLTRPHPPDPPEATLGPAEQAELVFLPYNYLIDSVVRTAMQISVSNAVLIFDEAHNLEDCCRCASAAPERCVHS